jgi:multicomponent Na+:H+ antiporter subunit F
VQRGGYFSMFVIVSVVILIAIAVGLVRAFLGPTLYDRVMAANMVGTLTVLMVAVLGFMTGRPEFLDIALVYVLISFVSTIAVLRVVSSRSNTTASGEE